MTAQTTPRPARPPRQRQAQPRPYFAGVTIVGVPGGGTLEQARELVATNTARYLLRELGRGEEG